MIILDTNVVSELMKPSPAPQVLGWFESVPHVPVALTAITVAELRYGVACLPAGRRKQDIAAAIDAMVTEDFADSILPFDNHAAEAYGVLAARYRVSGIAVGQADAMIAAIALSAGAEIATRNTRDFRHSGVTLHDPFEASVKSD